MVAVGSNASSSVMRVKLGHSVELFALEVGNLAVGHSAHVSRRGYVPATPITSPGASLTTMAAWLHADELATLDETEPNYDRLTVTTHDHPLNPPVAESFALYVSRHGALGDPAGRPLSFGTQQDVFDWLHGRLHSPVLRGRAEQVCRRLAEPTIAARVADDIRTHGLAFPAWPTTAAVPHGGEA